MFASILVKLVTLFWREIIWSVETFVSIKSFIRKFAKRHALRLEQMVVSTKMLSVVLILGLAPFLPHVDTNKTKVTPVEVKMVSTAALPVQGKDRQVAIETGTSNDEAAKSYRVASTRNVAYSAPVSNIERDPSYFRELYIRAGAAYGVPWQLLEAVHYTETGCSDSTTESSYAGAMGPMQFMPGTWRTYAVDGDGDGSADITNVNDAVYGAANLLANGGAAEGNYQAALFNYNHSQSYVNKVMGIAQDAGM